MKPKKINPLLARMRVGNSSSFVAIAIGLAGLGSISSTFAANQVYQDANIANVWDTTTANWDAGVVWTNSNTATFQGTGETVTVNAVTTTGITFASAGYVLSGGTITLGSNSTVSATSNATINSAVTGAAVNLTKSGAGTLTLGGAHSYTGTLVLNGGGNLVLASGFSGSSLAAISLTGTSSNSKLTIEAGSSITTKYIGLGDSGGSQSGRIEQTGGTVTMAAGGNGIRIGHWNNGGSTASTYLLSGGTLDAAALSGNSGSSRIVNVGWDGTGTMVVGGGAGTATLKAFGIQLDANGNGGGNDGGNDTLTVSANGVVEVGGGGIAGAATGDVLILDGGSLKATAAATWGSLVNANASTTTGIDANTFAVTLSNNLSGTGTINLSAATGTVSFSTTGTQTVTPSFTGSTAVSKLGTGTTTLTGSLGTSAGLTVSAGRLNVSGSVTNPTTTVASGATLGGEGSVGGTTTFSAGSSLAIDPSTPGAITFNNLDITGQPTLAFSTVPTSATSPVTLFTHTGTLTSPNGLATDLKGLSGFRNPVITDTSGVVTLSVSSLAQTWSGPGTVWDLASTNWAGGTQAFAWGDAVTFDDSASVPTSLTLSGELRPASITVNSSTNNFTITGSAGNFIAGTTGLLKSGTSTLTMDGPHTFTGGAVISQGTVQIRSTGALGLGTVTLGDAATAANPVALYIDTNRVVYVRPIVVSNNGTGTMTLGTLANVTGAGAGNGFSGITLNRDVIFDSNAADRTDYANISGTGNITVKGAGRSLFTTANTFVGNLTIDPITDASGLQLGTNSTAFNAIPDTTNVTINTGGKLSLSYTAGGTETIGGLNGTGVVRNNGGNANTLIMGGGNNSGSFSGTIENGSTPTTAFAVTKSGTGTQVLSGTNTYTGVTNISGGILQFGKQLSLYNNTQASWSAANLIVASGATVAFNVGGASEFDNSNVTLLLNNLKTITSNGLLAGSSVGFDTTNATGGTFTIADVIANSTGTGSGAVGLRKLGAGTLVLSGASTYTGTTFVQGGTLEVNGNASGVAKFYNVSPGATLLHGYSTSVGFGYGCGVTVNGVSTASASGLYLKGGQSMQFGGTLTLQTAPSTVRSYGTGNSTLSGGDVNNTHLSVPATGSGSVLDSTVNVACNSYGYRLNVASGANNATGDLTINGVISGNGNVNWGGAPANLLKYGNGSLKITGGSNTLVHGVWAQNGSLILSGGANRLPTATTVMIGDINSGTTAKLILDGISQTLAEVRSNSLSVNSNAVVGGSATLSTLNLSSAANNTLLIKLGGSGTNEDNLSLTKSGSGVLTLANFGNTYAGGTSVSGGVLRITDFNGTSAGTGTVTVNSGGNLDGYGVLNVGVVVSAAGGTVTGGLTGNPVSGDILTVDSLTFDGTGVISVTPNMTQIAVTNGLTASGGAGSVTVNLGSTTIPAGTYTLVTHNGAIGGTGISAFVVGTNPGGPFNYTLSDDGSALTLTVTTSALFWGGDNGDAWTATNNWKTSGGSPVTFSAGSAVVFDDFSSNLFVDLSSVDVNPSSVTFSNTIGYDYTLAGSKSITGTGGLLKSGTGSVTINNTNSFTGAVALNQGSLNVASIANAGVNSSIGAGTAITIGGGTLAYTGLTAASTDRTVAINGTTSLDISAGDLELNGVVSGGGAITKLGLGTLKLGNAANTLSGAIDVTAGAVSVDDLAKLGTGTLTLSSGTLSITGTTAITTAKAIALGAGGGVIDVSNTGGVTHSGAMTGSTSLTKKGAGKLTLSTNKSMSGPVTVDGGTLLVTAGGWYTNPFGSTSTVTINAGATLETNGAHTLGTDQINIVINGGTLKLGREQYATTLKMTGGLVTGNTDPSTEIRNWGGTMNFYASPTSAEIATKFNLVANAVLNVEDGAATEDLLISGSIGGGGTLTKTGAGRLALSAVNTYATNTTVSAGTLDLKDNARLAFAIPASGSANHLSGAGNAELQGDFYINVTAAAALATGSWLLEDITGTATYAGTFQVVDADGTPWTHSGTAWTKIVGSQLWTYEQTTGVLTLAQAGYDSWASQITNPADRDRTDDPDGDGLTNIQEFLFGTNPTTNDGTLIASERSGGNLVIRWYQRETAATYTLKESTTLESASWTTSALVPALDGDQSGTPTDYDRWSVTIPLTEAKKFFRVLGAEN